MENGYSTREHKESKQLIGDCAIKLDPYDTRIAEIDHHFHLSLEKKGYAKEADDGASVFSFWHKGVHRVVEIVDAENTASICLLNRDYFR